MLSEDKRLYQASQFKVKYLKENVKMEYTEFEQYFSTQRISRYVQATNKSITYLLNILLIPIGSLIKKKALCPIPH